MFQPLILVIDDQPLVRLSFEALLENDGYRLHFAVDGKEGLSKAAELHPDVILLDVMMPAMDGFEVCRQLRADPSLAEIPILMATALDDRDSKLRGGVFYVLDVNPNADIGPDTSLALAAEMAGLSSYGKPGSLLVNLAAQRHRVFRSLLQ